MLKESSALWPHEFSWPSGDMNPGLLDPGLTLDPLHHTVSRAQVPQCAMLKEAKRESQWESSE